MVRSSIKSKRKVESPSMKEVQKDRKGAQKKLLLGKARKRQKELNDTRELPSNAALEFREGNGKLKFSEIRSAFATYASTTPTVSPVSHPTKRKSTGRSTRDSTSTSNCTIVEECDKDVSGSKRKFEECDLYAKKCHHDTEKLTSDSGAVGHGDQNGNSYVTCSLPSENLISPFSEAPGQLEKNSEKITIPCSDNEKSDNITSLQNHASPPVAHFQSETSDNFLEHELSEEILHPNFQEDCDKYAETFLNFKNVIKSQRLSNLPDVVVLPIKERMDQALVGFNENIYLYGCASIKVMKGTISVHGSLLTSNASEVTFYSPLYDPALVIRSLHTKKSESDVSHEHSMIQKLLKDTLSDHTTDFGKVLVCSTVVLLSGLKKRHVYPKLNSLFEAPTENVAWKELCKGCFLVGPNCIFIDFPGYHLACEDILPQNEKIYGQSCPNNTVVVTVGSKGAGKSTFNRYLINCLLNQYDLVNYIDCDIGQPEFTISGCLSVNHVTSPILGPPFTHLKHPHFAVYYGAVTASHDVDRYIESVKDLTLHVKPGYPVVVNTMGWIKDVGMNLLADIIRLMQPSYVVQLSSRKEVRAAPLITQDYVDQFDSLKFTTTPQSPDYKHIWIKTDLPTSNLATVNPAERRLLRTLSYFSQVQNDCVIRDFQGDGKVLNLRTLCALKPYIVFVKNVLLCACHETGVLRQHALSAFNCSIVSLSVVSETHFKDHSIKKFLEAPPTSKCFGFGIVRGVDPQKQALYVISNLPRETLLKVNCLSIGSLTIPDVLYSSNEARPTDDSAVPYIVNNFPFHITGSNRFRSYKVFK